MNKSSHKSHWFRDFLFYVVIGIVVASSAILLGVHQAKVGEKPDALLKWIGFTMMTLLVFSWTIRAYRSFWATARFWRYLALFAVVHIFMGVIVVSRISGASLFPFMVVTVAEASALGACLNRFVS
jgi:hypothetical protein